MANSIVYRKEVEPVRFENDIRIKFGIHFRNFDAASGTLFLEAHETELLISLDVIHAQVAASLANYNALFEGLTDVMVTYHPRPAHFRVNIAA